MTNNINEELALVATIDGQLLDNASATSDWVDMENGAHLMFTIGIGATDTTVDAKLQEADDASGTNAADITGKAITQLSGTDDNKQAILEVRGDELSKKFVALVVTAGDGATGAQVYAIGQLGRLRYKPASNFNLASVAEIVAPE